MSQDMSSFFTGMRRILPERVPRTRPIMRSAATPGAATARAVALAATRNRRLHSGAAPVGAEAAAAAAGTGTGAAFNRRKPMATRLTGGGPGPTGIFQSTNSTMRRQQTGHTPSARIILAAPRRFREIEWIMKPSKNFMQCSKSSSEDSFPDGASNMEKLQEKSWRSRRGNRNSWSSESSGCSGDSDSSSGSGRERTEGVPPRQHLVDLLKSSYQGTPMRTKKRSSRVFCVPNQRILHADELLQAQMLQMRPRKMKYPQLPATGTHVLCQATPSKSSHRPLPSRKPSENVLLHVTSTVTQIQPENPYLDTPTGLMSCSPSPTTSAQPSQVQIQPSGTSPHSQGSIEKSPSSSASSSDSVSSQPSQIPMAKPTINTINTANTANTANSTNSSSLSTSGTECSVERMDQRYRGTAGGSKAIKLTSTVIKIMPDKARASQRTSKGKVRQQSRIKLRSKTTSQFLPKGAKDSAINQALNSPINQALNSPMIQAIGPPASMPRVKVSRTMIRQSVHQVVSQLTAQLKKAVGEDQHQPAKAKATGQQWPRKLGRKTSIYMLMDQAKPDEPTPSTKNDWVIQPMEQQMISAMAEQLPNPKDQEPVNPYISDSMIAVGHRYTNTPRDYQGESREEPNLNRYNSEIPKSQVQLPMIPSQSPPPPPPLVKQSELSLNPDSRNAGIHNRIKRQPRGQPSERSPRRHPRSLANQPVSLNRIPQRIAHPPTVPTLQEQPNEVEPKTEVVTSVAGKIVRKAQHKVPKTMEDGIDMSYQYFVSLPLKRGRKPQVVRYLYRPMVRNLNGLPNSGRRSKRAKRRRAAAAAAAAAKAAKATVASSQSELEELDPALAALGGAPLPLENPPIVDEETMATKKSTAKIFDPEVTLNSPYRVPPLKLKSRYMSMLEELEQMPFPDERLSRRRLKRSHRQNRAAGGSELLPSPAFEVQSLQGTGGGDVIAEDTAKERTPVIVWNGRPAAPPVPRITVVDYQKEPTRLCTATGLPMMYHQPLFLTLKDAKNKPMIQTYTYENIEQEEQQREQLEREKEQLEQKLEREQRSLKLEKEQLQLELEKVQLQREQVAKEKMEIMEQQDPMATGQEATVMAKSVSFYPDPIFASSGSTSGLRSTTSSSSSILETKRKSKVRKGKKTRAKGKGKNHSKGKGRK